MNETTQDTQTIKPAALERLRDRTDELELIISSLTIFALFSLPGWMFDQFANSYTHLSTELVIASTLGIALLTGFCYVLGACFIIHLMARAYWVGLIGLRAAFPDGVKWDRTGSGPLTREYYRTNLPGTEDMIRVTDKFASSLFAIISMITLGALWSGAVILMVLVPLGTIGAQFGATNASIGYGQNILIGIYVGVPFVTFLLDGLLATRVPSLQNQIWFKRLITGLRGISKFAYPSRLIQPVKLTLQSNTQPLMFTCALVVGAALIITIGFTRLTAWTNFSLSSEFTYFDVVGANDFHRSTSYEDTASSLDRLRGAPRISSFEQSGSYMRVFLPYHPLRDNRVLDELCTASMRETDINDCLRMMWKIRLGDTDVDLAEFLPAERFDTSMRGLIGAVPLSGVEPGINTLVVTWNPSSSTEESRALGDRYQNLVSDIRIPFLFNPAFERPLE